MGFFDIMKRTKNNVNETKGGYIFLSHSHADIEKVREIRNSLEREGFEPLCFYLKCLSDDSEIEDLIKREIDAREWFVFVNSENSRKSRWVTLEREYITRTNSKKILKVDLDDDKSVEEVIYKISHNLRIFIACSMAERKLAHRIKAKLKEKDYLVMLDLDDIDPGIDYTKELVNAIYEASKEGAVLVLLSASSINSRWFEHEVIKAIEYGGNIIPVLVGDVELSDMMQLFISRYKSFRLSEHPCNWEIDALVDEIGRYVIRK